MINVKVGKTGDTVLASELGEHVATITVRGASVREPLQKARLPVEKQTWGGEGSFWEVSHAKSSSCQRSLQLHMSPLSAPSPTSASGSQRDTNPAAGGLRRTLSSSGSRDLHSSPI